MAVKTAVFDSSQNELFVQLHNKYCDFSSFTCVLECVTAFSIKNEETELKEFIIVL